MNFMVAVIVALIAVLPDKYYHSGAVQMVKHFTGRDLLIDEFSITRALNPTVQLKNVTLSSTEWTRNENLVTASTVTMSFSLPDIFRGRLNIHRLSTTDVDLHLEKNDSQLGNWQLRRKSDPLKLLTNLAKNVQIYELYSKETTVSYLHSGAGIKHEMSLVQSTINTDKDRGMRSAVSTGTINSIPFKFNGNMPVTESASTPVQTVLPLTFSGMLAGITVTGSSDIVIENLESSFNSFVSINMNTLSELNTITSTALPDIGPLSVTASISGELDSLDTEGLEIPAFEIHVDDPNLSAKARGALASVLINNTGVIHVEAISNNIQPIVNSFNVDLAESKLFPATTNVSATLNIDDDVLNMQIHQAGLDSDFFNTQVSGTVGDLFDTALANLDVAMQAPNMTLVTHLFGQRMPPEWGPLDATASLVGSKKSGYGLEKIVATLTGRSSAIAKGHIKSLYPFDNMSLDTTATLSTLNEISAFTPKPLPDIGPMNGHGTVIWQDGKLSLVDARAIHDSDYGVMVLTGKIGDLIHFDGARIRADAALPDFSALDLFTGYKSIPVDSVVASANLITDTALDLSAKNLKFVVMKDGVQVNGEGIVHSIIRKSVRPDIKLSSNIKSLQELHRFTDLSLPEIGPVSVTGALVGTGRDIQLVDINALFKDKALYGSIYSKGGTISQLRAANLVYDLQSDSLKNTLARVGYKTSITEPAILQGTMRLAGNSLKFDEMLLQVKGNTLRGAFDVEGFADRAMRARISGDINIERLDLPSLFPHPDGQVRNDVNREPNTTLDRLLPDDPLPHSPFFGHDIDIAVKIGELKSALFDVSNANFAIESTDGRLTMSPFSGTVNQGRASIFLMIDSNQTPAKTTLDMSLDDVDLSILGLVSGSGLVISEGGTHARLSLTGEGNSIASILGSVNGEGGLYIENLIIKQGALKLVSSDILDQLLAAINPFKKKKPETFLKCSALVFQINDGLVNTPYGFAVEASDFSVIGSGSLNFKDELIDLDFRTKPKKGLGLSLNKFASLVKLSGPLTKPQVTFNRKGLFRFSASLAAAVASGGLTYVAEGLYEKQQANSDVCAKALGQ